MKEQLDKIRECIATMMDVLPNPAVAVVTHKNEKKPKHEVGEVDKEHNGKQES